MSANCPAEAQAAVELEHEAATKLAYFLNLLRPHLPAHDRFNAGSCRFVTVSVVAAIHVVRLTAHCSCVSFRALSNGVCAGHVYCWVLAADGCSCAYRRSSREGRLCCKQEASEKAARSTRNCLCWSTTFSRYRSHIRAVCLRQASCGS